MGELKFKATIVKEIFYNESNNFGIYAFVTNDDIPYFVECTDLFHQGKSATIKGAMQRLGEDIEYTIVAELVVDKKYGKQYNAINIIKDVPKTPIETRNFLISITKNTSVINLLEAYPNIVNDIIEDNNYQPDLSKVKGIKVKNYKKIRDKIIENFCISDIIALLAPLGVTETMIKNILHEYKNTELLRQKIINNPYMLIGKVPRLTFKKIDEFALKLNPSLEKSKQRIYAAMYAILYKLGEDSGDTVINITDFNREIKSNIPKIYNEYLEIMKEEKEHPTVVKILDNGKCGLISSYEIEKYVWNRLNEIRTTPNNYKYDITKLLEGIEERIGYSVSDEQKQAVEAINDNNVVIVTGKAGCVDRDTEFFDGTKWKKISDYIPGDKVLQWTPPVLTSCNNNNKYDNISKLSNAQTELVEPLEYIKIPCNTLYHFETKYGLSQTVCPEHRIVYASQKGKIYETNILDIKEQQKETTGFRGGFITTFNYSGTGINLSDEEIRIMVAVIADGSYTKNNTNLCRFHIKKDRKKQRLESLFKSANLEYRVAESATDGYTDYYIYTPIKTKIFTSEWYNCTAHQKEIIIDEVMNWDGHISETDNGVTRYNFSTTIKENADFVQFVYSSMGHKASIHIYDRRNKEHFTHGKYYTRKSIEYSVQISSRQSLSSLCYDKRGNHTKTPITTVETIDGYKYCFKVPSSYLVLRKDNCIFITGNCGKSTALKAILDVYKTKNIAITAFSAKAARRTEEVTGVQAYTIHKLLGATERGFMHNEHNLLRYDMVIIDEMSMVNTGLFCSLLKALPLNCKIVMVGDFSQLPAIGSGALFSDIINLPNEFKKIKLTKVFRQAAESGIITDANKIREGLRPFTDFKPRMTSGIKQDMFYIFNEDKEYLKKYIVQAYFGFIEKGYPVEQVQIIVPRRDNCTISTKEINKIILDKLIPQTSNNTITYINKTFRKGCRVINTVNDYQKEDIEDKEVGIFNGETGIVTDIKDKSLLVDFGNKVIKFEDLQIDNLELAYCLTVHKLQGSECKVAIIGLETGHYTLLSRELMYTAVTRAKEKCIVISEPKAFNLAYLKSSESQRHTFWQLGIF